MIDKPLKVDLCVIGAGAAGLSVASGAVQLGFDVALIEKGEMGGDCLNTGCVPSKAMLAAAKTAQSFRNAEQFGITSVAPDINFRGVKTHVRQVIARIEPHDSQERFEGLGVRVFREPARFINKNIVQTGNQKIAAKYFVIATGSRAAIPPIEGLDPDKVLTNETLFDLKEKPEHLIIIGGGPIGIEMAQAHNRLGSKVTVLEMNSILPHDDPELVEFVRTSLTEEGVHIIEGADVKFVAHGEGSVEVKIEKDGDATRIKGTHLLIAAGRTPNIEALDLDAAGIEYDSKSIKTDARLRTNIKNIYAAGDVSGGPQFTHVAGYHAGIIIKNMMFKLPGKVDYKALPWVTYTEPELANAGLTEAGAREKHGDSIQVIKWSLKDNDRGQTDKNTSGLIKVITDKKGKILGAGIAAPHAGELIGSWALAISEGLKIGAFANMIAPYPTYGEISKRAGGAYFTPKLFNDRTRFFISLLQKLPF